MRADTGRGGGPPEALGEPAVALAEVADAEGVDEVVRDVATVERGAELGFVADVDGTRLTPGEIAAVAARARPRRGRRRSARARACARRSHSLPRSRCASIEPFP